MNIRKKFLKYNEVRFIWKRFMRTHWGSLKHSQEEHNLGDEFSSVCLLSPVDSAF